MEITEQELQEKIDSAVSGLKTKNDELLDKITKMKKTLKDFEDIDIDLLKKQSKELEKLKEDMLSDEEKKAKRIKEEKEKRLQIEQDLLDTKQKLQLTKKKFEITKALNSLGTGVKKGMDEAVQLLLETKSSINEEGLVVIGDKSVTDYVKEWAEKEGREFFIPRNSGGGANNNGNYSVSEYQDYFDPKSSKYNITQQVMLKKENEKLYNTLKEMYK